MVDNSLIARLRRHKDEVKAKALIDETIEQLEKMHDQLQFIARSANSALVQDPRRDPLRD